MMIVRKIKRVTRMVRVISHTPQMYVSGPSAVATVAIPTPAPSGHVVIARGRNGLAFYFYRKGGR